MCNVYFYNIKKLCIMIPNLNFIYSLVKGLIIANLWEVRFGGVCRIPENKKENVSGVVFFKKEKHC